MKKASNILTSVILWSLFLTTPLAALVASSPNPEINSVQDKISLSSVCATQLAKETITDPSKGLMTNSDFTRNKEGRHDYFSADWWVVYVTGLLAIITGALAIYTGKLFKATVALSQDSRKSYIAEHRTWIKIYPVDVGPVSVNGGKVHVSITFEIEVAGRLPAVQIHIASQPFQGRMFSIGKCELEKLIAMEMQFALPDSSGFSMMPGDKRTMRFSADATIDSVAEAKAKQQEDAGVLKENILHTLSVAYCVIYKSLTSEEWCHTGHTLFLTMNGTPFNPDIDGEIASGNMKATVMDSIIS
jgi:hypothetical protein